MAEPSKPTLYNHRFRASKLDSFALKDTPIPTASKAIFAESGDGNFSGNFTGNGSGLTNLQRPISNSISTHFTASNLNAGFYFRVGGNVTCSIQSSSLVTCDVGNEFKLFQTSSAGQTLILTGSGVTLNSKNGNINLNGQFSLATLKKVGNDEWDLTGDIK
tara:strand:- start:2636 stop:3118 length:483 start_codon:yes stop_codon:yes gene_type:complete